MKKLLPLLAICALFVGCKSISTKSVTEFLDANGNKIAEHKEVTASRGLFVKSESIKVNATISYTNTAPGFTVSETKVFGADKIGSEGDAAAIGAAGDAAGSVIGNLLNKAVTP